jgi:hypothetical protein
VEKLDRTSDSTMPITRGQLDQDQSADLKIIGPVGPRFQAKTLSRFTQLN